MSRRRSDLRDGVQESTPPHQLVVQASEIGVLFLPVDFGKAEYQVAERASDSHVGEREMGSHAPGVVGKFARHELQAADDLVFLACNPVAALLRARPLLLEKNQCGRIAHAVSQGLPALDFGTLAILPRHQLVVRGNIVQVLDNHP
jgi:hypothetical protein